MSSEAEFACQMAHAYGPKIVRLSRGERIIWLQQKIEIMQENLEIDQQDHRNECEECYRGENCYWSVEKGRRFDAIRRLEGMICQEQQDQKYAERAKLHGVEYRKHVDVFCSYWQNLRHRKFLSVAYVCERCGRLAGPLECHHLHYDTLGFEELSDVQALCKECHPRADRERAYSAGLNTYASKKYGEHWEEHFPIEEIEDEFDDWIGSREDDE